MSSRTTLTARTASVTTKPSPEFSVNIMRIMAGAADFQDFAEDQLHHDFNIDMRRGLEAVVNQP